MFAGIVRLFTIILGLPYPANSNNISVTLTCPSKLISPSATPPWPLPVGIPVAPKLAKRSNKLFTVNPPPVNVDDPDC